MVIIKSEQEIDAIKRSSRLAASVLQMIEPHVKSGVSTLELNDICHEYIVSRGAIPATLNYKGFSKSVCISINEVVCHGIPNAKTFLKNGDIVNIDVTTILDGYYGDTSKTYFVGECSVASKKLVKITEECMWKGIGAVKVGARLGDVGAAIQAHAESNGFSVVREFVGHGIGKAFHEDPQVLHYGELGKGARIEAGMVFTIEPMINEGTWRTKTLKDGWTVLTLDKRLSAQFEHTVAVRHNGTVDVLTNS